ncbi:mycothiol transferase [Nocardioides marmoraquaticus]
METRDLLLDHLDRVRELVETTAHGLPLDDAHLRPVLAPSGDPAPARGNSIVWLLWHTARVQDDHVAALAGVDQAWDAWAERFALPLDHADIGYGHGDAQVDAVRVDDLTLLVDYHRAVHDLSRAYAERVDAAELDRVVDEAWDPPVTAGVRLVSVVGDCLQHLGQAAYVRGLLAS